MNHYDTLEVSRVASPEVIRAAYRSLMQRHHPDRHPGDAAAAARAASITQAYEVLSDPGRRTAYDQSLPAAAAPAPAAAAHPARSRVGAAARPPERSWRRWWLAAAIVLVAVGGWAAASLYRAKLDPRSELMALRHSFSDGTLPEVRRRELHARKQSLLLQQPELQRAEAAARSADLAERTLPLLTVPLVVQLGQGRPPPAEPMQLTIPQLAVRLGSFEAPRLMEHIERHRQRLVQDLSERLGREDPGRFGGADGERQLRLVSQQSLAASLGTDAGREFPSTWFESPGRHGVVAVELPEPYRLVQLSSLR